MSGEPIRRFYKETGVTQAKDGFGVRLDQRSLKTRSGQVFLTPTRALAEACATEWDAQDKLIAPLTMPMTRFVNVAIDVTREKRADLIEHVVKYVGTDLLCHRAASPVSLAARQAEAWDPVLAWAKAKYNLAPPVVVGIIAADASEAEARLRAHAEALDEFWLTGLGHAIGLSGSALLGLALVDGEIDAASAYHAAALDNLWSMENWGEDEEARARLDRLAVEFNEAVRFFGLLA
jgi:chaperone required for assembly of F1-ATPase